METIIIQIKKKFESKALEIIQNQQEKQNSQNSPPIDLFNNLVNRFQKQVNKFNKPDFEHDFNPEDGILMRDNEGVLSDYYFNTITQNTTSSQLHYAIGLYAASELELQAHNTQQAFDYLLDAYYRIGYCDGLSSYPSGNTSDKALEERRADFSRRGSKNKRTQDSEKTKKEVIDYLTADPDKKNWRSYREAIKDIIPMLIQKSLELEGTESSFKVNKDTIRSNLMTWFRPKSGDSESNKNYQQSIKNIFSEKSK
ncbi:hypothetical protein EX227_15660 [Providencia rettgeri]|uniref:Uncharacterized protein n=2 Tax=Providencia TaxID=586 RepID=A0A9N8GY89_PRORE|nr:MULTISPECIES: hypothetical protein [Providencia]HEM8344293.1 hypothetical protein [Providencia stuartii]EKH6496573.1 hypothetical protein [Providencia rettgeri]ELR5052061.1 hypothetical protein [Providencia rettgeri]ELR5157144.1 hypothetical protein [Providencia rettgeri]ELR5182308.1 hypothetical protein [Providencia rettgeri]